MFTSIALARVYGPAKLGYFNYIMWLANTSGVVGSMGIPTATRKYMAEYLNKGEHAIARAIFETTFRFQLAIAAAISSTGIAVLLIWGDPQYRWTSLLQIVSVLPSMAVFVPSQANTARENMKANVAASIAGQTIYTLAILVAIFYRYPLVYIAAGILLSRIVEFVWRYLPVRRWINSLPLGSIPASLRSSMLTFAAETVVLLLLNVVVWDRSDIVVLKWMSRDIAQITFFFVAFNLCEKAMQFPNVFGTAAGATLMAQFGRDRTQMASLLRNAARYTMLMTFPLLFGLAALAAPAMRALYGTQYLPAIPVLIIAALLAAPKTLLLPAQQFLQAHEDQRFMLAWIAFCGALDIGIDFLLIPHYGAMGAAIGNGTAQVLGTVGIWWRVHRRFGIAIDARSTIKIISATTIMGAVAAGTAWFLRPWPGLLLGTLAGFLTFLALSRLLHLFDESDRERFLRLRGSVPTVARGSFDLFLRALFGPIPPAASNAALA